MKEPQENQEIDDLFRKRFENFNSVPKAEEHIALFNKLDIHKKKSRRLAILSYGVAAAFLIALCSIVFIYFSPALFSKREIAVEKNILPDTAMKNIPIRNGTETKLKKKSADEQIKSNEPVAINPAIKSEEKDVVSKKLITQKKIVTGAETKEIVLPDSSHISLHAYSSISFQSNFQKERKVELNGDAIFTIQKRNGKNFKVVNGNFIVEVLGTTFFVHASGNSIEQVKVAEGKVAFYRADLTNTKVHLTKGEEGFLNGNHFPEKLPVQDDTKTSNQKELVFENTRMPIVIAKLDAYFSTRIIVADKNILNCAFSGSFVNPKTIEEVLDVITGALGLNYTREETQMVLSGKGCK